MSTQIRPRAGPQEHLRQCAAGACLRCLHQAASAAGGPSRTRSERASSTARDRAARRRPLVRARRRRHPNARSARCLPGIRPSRLVLAWQLTPDWKYDPDLVTEVEVMFTPEGERHPRRSRASPPRTDGRTRRGDARDRRTGPGGWGRHAPALFRQASEQDKENRNVRHHGFTEFLEARSFAASRSREGKRPRLSAAGDVAGRTQANRATSREASIRPHPASSSMTASGFMKRRRSSATSTKSFPIRR